jgi:hypothetical protein
MIVSSSRRSKKRRSRRGGLNPLQKEGDVSQVLQELRLQTSLLKAEQRSSLLEVKDVPRVILRRNKVHTFSRTVGLGDIVTSAVDVFGAYAFTIGALPGSADFLSLFDQYRLSQVTLTFSPVNIDGIGEPIYTVLDYDDAAVPTSTDVLRQYDNLKITPVSQYFERTLNPHVALAAYSGAFTSFANMAASWIDSGSPAVQFYGLKYAWPGRVGATGAFSVQATVTVQCRNTI